MKFSRKRIGLALGGGGARGLSHIGVLRVLERTGIPVDIIAGTSIGAVVGGAYACGITSFDLEKKVISYVTSPDFQSSAINAMANMYGEKTEGVAQKIESFLKNQIYIIQMLFRPGVMSTADFESMIAYFIPDILIQDTSIPFRAVATDLITGEEIIFAEGPLREAIVASSSLPGAVEPLKAGGKLLSDGGIVSMVPVNVARKEGADLVIAVAVDRDVPSLEELNTVRDIFNRASEITAARLEKYELMNADIIIRPDVKKVQWANFSQAEDLVGEGEKAAIAMLPRIESARSP
ncbi:MAG TPA: patatin-like phospholipase family protein, partial [Syntrophales bacterium]|nr:patatin-like phospholipase family protein [Syntrophales bacterium]